jgi:lactam utilization protein B
MQIVGLEGSSGISGKSGKAYEIGQLHSIVRLAPPLGDGNVAKGFMGSTYRVSVEIIKSLAHNTLPFTAEVEVQDVMRFGKREQEVTSVIPEKAGLAPKAA